MASDDHFTCAAMISAADQLLLSNRAPADAGISEKAALATMTHFNAWAIPKNIPEKQAFDEVKAERDRLIATLSPADIVGRAHACIDRV